MWYKKLENIRSLKDSLNTLGLHLKTKMALEETVHAHSDDECGYWFLN
jgi:hypothetical protein